jgi:hypothetical protein
MSKAADANTSVCHRAPIDVKAVEQWIERVPMIELAGKTPSTDALAHHLSEFWLPDESILYIGKASSLTSRLRDYYNTPLGDRRPHAGGHWIKTLSVLPDTFVHFAETSDPESKEDVLLRAFIRNVSKSTKERLRDPNHPFPFANLEFPKGTCKTHAIRKSKRED